jgi:prepilin-type N-terminal cleavage/methylation domain-containing protein
LHKTGTDGFTLIELLITIAIFSITLTFGVSSYRTWVLNNQIRNAAESISNGMQRTRAEAVKRNTNIAFVLGAASAWQIDIPGVAGASGVIETRSSSEGSKSVTVAVTPGGADTITYSNLGTVAPNGDGSATLSQIDLDSSVAGANARALRVAIGVGGDPRVCDPDPAITAKVPPDPRRCY